MPVGLPVGKRVGMCLSVPSLSFLIVQVMLDGIHESHVISSLAHSHTHSLT